MEQLPAQLPDQPQQSGMGWIARMGWGMVGAVAPTVFNLLQVVRVAPSQELPSFSVAFILVYLGVVVLYAAVAGSFSVALHPTNPWNAVYIGATAPTLLAQAGV